MTDFRYQHTGGCSCGAVDYLLYCNLDLDELAPRACQCEFCLPSGASYVSVPEGRLEIRVRDRRYLYAHVFGTFTADFMHCGRCNDLVYVSTEIKGRKLGLVVQQTMHGDIDVEPVQADYEGEALEHRLARRADNWIPELVLLEVGRK